MTCKEDDLSGGLEIRHVRPNDAKFSCSTSWLDLAPSSTPTPLLGRAARVMVCQVMACVTQKR